MEDVLAKVQDLVTAYGFKILAAIIILVIGRWVSGILRGMIRRALERAKVEVTVAAFASNLAYYAILIFVVVAALAELGIQTTSLIAVLGAAGLAIGLALQGSLSNFAAGVLMIVFRPFQVGHYIEGGGAEGTVEEIHILYTELVTVDNKVVVIPNAKLMGDKIINYSAKDTRRIDQTVRVGYSEDLQKVRGVLQQLIDSDDRILRKPESMIAVNQLAGGGVEFVLRVWVKTEDYWSVHFELMEKTKTSFDEDGISLSVLPPWKSITIT